MMPSGQNSTDTHKHRVVRLSAYIPYALGRMQLIFTPCIKMALVERHIYYCIYATASSDKMKTYFFVT